MPSCAPNRRAADVQKQSRNDLNILPTREVAMKLIRCLSLALLNRSGIGLILVLSLLLTHSIYSYSKQQKMTSIGRTTARDASVDGKRAISQLKQQGLYASIK